MGGRWSVVVGIALLVAAWALCCGGGWVVSANYDGIVSWFNPVGVGSCCGAVVLGVAGVVVLVMSRNRGDGPTA